MHPGLNALVWGPALALLAMGAGSCDFGYEVPTFPDAPVDARPPDAPPGAPDAKLACPHANTTVIIRSMAFQQPHITVAAGTRVTWMNQDAMEHDVTEGDPGNPAPAFTSGALQPGASWSKDFCEPTAVVYFCSTHPMTMKGATVTVTP